MIPLALLGVALARERAVAQAQAQAAEPTVAQLLQGRTVRGDPDVGQLQALLAQLRDLRGHEAARDALQAAERAIARAAALGRAGDAAAATRAKQVAWSALSLGDRRIARAQEQERLMHARVRKQRATKAAAAAAQALQHAKRQHERAQAAAP